MIVDQSDTNGSENSENVASESSSRVSTGSARAARTPTSSCPTPTVPDRGKVGSRMRRSATMTNTNVTALSR